MYHVVYKNFINLGTCIHIIPNQIRLNDSLYAYPMHMPRHKKNSNASMQIITWRSQCWRDYTAPRFFE